MEDSFKLYSVGESFVDNGSTMDKKAVWQNELSLHIYSPDIIYWPVRIVETETKEYLI